MRAIASTEIDTNKMSSMDIGLKEKKSFGARNKIKKHKASMDRARMDLYLLSGRNRLSMMVNAPKVAVYAIRVGTIFI